LHEILEEASKNKAAKPGSTDQKIGDFYSSCMDESKREAEGAKPLAPYFARIEKVDSLKALAGEVGGLHATESRLHLCLAQDPI